MSKASDKKPIDQIKALMDRAHKIAKDNDLQFMAFWTDIDEAGKGNVRAAVNAELPFIRAIFQQLAALIQRHKPGIEPAEKAQVDDAKG